jgi:hypothetical protein
MSVSARPTRALCEGPRLCLPDAGDQPPGARRGDGRLVDVDELRRRAGSVQVVRAELRGRNLSVNAPEGPVGDEREERPEVELTRIALARDGKRAVGEDEVAIDPSVGVPVEGVGGRHAQPASSARAARSSGASVSSLPASVSSIARSQALRASSSSPIAAAAFANQDQFQA